MLAIELSLCIAAVVSSSASQVSMKVASSHIPKMRGLIYIAVSIFLMIFSILAAFWVLRTIALSKLVPFAAGAYILVPMGGAMILGEKIHREYWIGVVSIMVGLYLTVL